MQHSRAPQESDAPSGVSFCCSAQLTGLTQLCCRRLIRADTAQPRAMRPASASHPLQQCNVSAAPSSPASGLLASRAASESRRCCSGSWYGKAAQLSARCKQELLFQEVKNLCFRRFISPLFPPPRRALRKAAELHRARCCCVALLCKTCSGVRRFLLGEVTWLREPVGSTTGETFGEGLPCCVWVSTGVFHSTLQLLLAPDAVLRG